MQNHFDERRQEPARERERTQEKKSLFAFAWKRNKKKNWGTFIGHDKFSIIDQTERDENETYLTKNNNIKLRQF